MSEDLLDSYARLGRTGPIESLLGQAIISLVEPHLGEEQGYNRWYEDDHMIISAMACPWVFAGKRWVATKALREMRSPRVSSVADPVELGCFLAAYWIVDGHYEEFLAWARSLVIDRLMPVGRMSPARKHIFTNDQNFLGAVYRDERGPRAVHALDYPYPGLVFQVIEARSPEDKPALLRWLTETHIPSAIAGSPAAMALIFESREPPRPKPGIDWYDRRLTLMWFLEEAPERSFAALFPLQEAAVAASGLGSVQLAAPFIPVLPGTDIHIDELR